MYESKNWYESKAAWAGVVTMAAGIAGAAGVVIGLEDQEQLVGIIITTITSVSGLIGLYGRITAKSRIK